MAQPASFWQRVGSMFRTDTDHVTFEDPTPTNGGLHLAPRDQPWWKGGTRAQLSDVSRRVVALADTLREHLERQEQQAGELNQTLHRVGGVLEQLATAQREQGEHLRTIATQAELTGRHTSGLSDTLARIPEALLAQADAVRTVSRQVEASQRGDAELVQSLQHFGRTLETLGTAGTSQVQALERMNSAQQEQQTALAALVRHQSRWLVAVLVAVAVLALLTAGAIAATWYLR